MLVSYRPQSYMDQTTFVLTGIEPQSSRARYGPLFPEARTSWDTQNDSEVRRFWYVRNDDELLRSGHFHDTPNLPSGIIATVPISGQIHGRHRVQQTETSAWVFTETIPQVLIGYLRPPARRSKLAGKLLKFRTKIALFEGIEPSTEMLLHGSEGKDPGWNLFYL